MKLALLLTIGLVLAVGTAADAPAGIASHAQDFFTKLRNGDTQGLQQKYITKHTMLRCYTVLPFGGLYRGNEDIGTFHARFAQFINVKSWTFNLTFANDYNGYSMTVLTVNGVRNVGNNPKNVDLNLVLTFNVLMEWFADGKLKRSALILVDDLLVHDKIKTVAEQRLHKLGQKMLEMKGGDMSADVIRDYIDENVKLTLYNFGHAALLPKTSFQGIDQIRQGLQAFKKAFLASDCVRSVQFSLCNSKIRILSADDVGVIFKVVLGGGNLYLPQFIIGAYQFNPAGKLVSIALTSSNSVHPWQIMKSMSYKNESSHE